MTAPESRPCRPGGMAITEQALAGCRFPPGARLLDLGCGSGATVNHAVREHRFDAWGIDRDPAVVAGHSRLLCADAGRLPFPAGVMDGVLLECSLSVMENPEAVLGECRRVLKPNGRLILSDLYARGRPVHLRLGGLPGRVENRETLTAMLTRQRLAVDCFVDCSDRLRSWWGQMVFERGAAEAHDELGAAPQALQLARCGYALFIAGPAGMG